MIFSDVLGTVDYVNESNGYVVHRTSQSEKEHLVFQMGTASPTRAANLGKFVQDDVAAIGKIFCTICPNSNNSHKSMASILFNLLLHRFLTCHRFSYSKLCVFTKIDFFLDVNMGCPKPYSCDFGMGAALLRKPDRAKEILKALVGSVQVPVTCKIRFVYSSGVQNSSVVRIVHKLHFSLKFLIQITQSALITNI